MRSIGLLNLAALVSSVTILAIAFVLVPDKSWTTATIGSIVIFALSVGFIFYLPAVLVKRTSGSAAAQIASLGPLGAITGLTLPLTAGAFVLALLGWEKSAWALDLFAVGSFIVGGLTLRAALGVVGNVAARYSVASSHIRWQGEIQLLRGMASEVKSRAALEQLAEKMRYAASDVPGGSPHDDAINVAVRDMGEQFGRDSAANMQSQIAHVEILMAQRDVFLRSARNKS